MYRSVYHESVRRSSNIQLILGIIILFISISTILIYFRIGSSDNSIYNTNDSVDLLAKCARIAWRYYQPGVGVNPDTGLHYAKFSWHGFTDWDLAGYILTVIDAGDIGLINVDGEWGVKYRLRKILDFLANRKLSPDGIPYWAYNADTGNPTNTNRLTTPSDSGRLLIALYKIKKRFPEYANIVDYIVYNKTNYNKMASNPNLNWGSGFYLYYIAQGFRLFGFDKYEPVKKGLNEINKLMNGDFVNIYGIDIPVTFVTSEPVIHGILDLNLDGDFRILADRVYKVQELRYNKTGKYTAFSEGAYYGTPSYIYEWIVQGSPNKLWTVTYATSSGLEEANISPVIFTKIGISFYAIYHTAYAEELTNYLVSRTTSSYGFYEGVNENGGIDPVITDKTNSMIINAVRYAGVHVTQVGYKLTIRVVDWDGINPLSNAKVYANNVSAVTNNKGIVTFNNLHGNVTIKVYYLSILVASNISYYLNGDLNTTIKTNVYDLNIYVYGGNGEDIIGVILNLTIGNSTINSSPTNEEGYARLENLPLGTYNLSIHPVNSSILLKEVSLTLNVDEETIYIQLDSYANIKITSDISIYV